MTTVKKHYDILFCILTAVILCYLFWKCRFGFANVDESFYLTIPWRLCQGDSLFVNEWHLSQMTGFLLMPFMYVYRLFHPDAEGIALTFRHLCLVVQTLCSIYFYIRLRKWTPLGALATALFALVYLPFGITALSYNSLGILLLGVSAITLATNDVCNDTVDVHKSATSSQAIHGRSTFFAGLSFAGAVLCCPYLIIVFAIYAVFVLIMGPGLRRVYLLFFTLGAASLAVVFAAFVFSRASLREVLDAFPLIFQDPEHQSVSFFLRLGDYFKYIFYLNPMTPVIYSCWGVLLLAALLDRKRMAHRAVYFTLISLCVIALTITMLFNGNGYIRYINFVMFPINLLTPFCLLLSTNPRRLRLFWLIVVPGLLYSMCISFTSNQEFFAISSASAVALFGSLPMVTLYMEETRADRYVFALLSLMILVVFSSLFSLRHSSVFWENSMEEQTRMIENGPEAGLMVSEEKWQLYQSYQDELAVIREDPKVGSVLYLSENTWFYFLSPHQRISAYSAWLSGVNDLTLNRLSSYYKLCPDKLPDVVFIDQDRAAFGDFFVNNYEYKMVVTPQQNVLLYRHKQP